MKATSSDIAQALLDLAKTMPDGQKFLRDIRDELAKHVGGEEAVRVVLTTPTGDAGPLKASVSQLLQKKLNRPVEITERADPSLIGGAVILFEDEQVDLSVRGALEQAQEAFAHSL